VFDHYQAQVAASDVNADGIALSVADLVYLVRVVVGDALPYPKVAPEAHNILVDGSVITTDAKMGGAALVVADNVTPRLLIDGVEMQYAYDANENVTRILVLSNSEVAIEGAFLDAAGEILSLEMATIEGAPVAHKLVPANFELSQNYPNPFNPTTTVSFSLPTESDWTVTLFNVTGQEVQMYSGHDAAGSYTIEVDGSDMASGVYFYRLDAGQESATKKMVLLK